MTKILRAVLALALALSGALATAGIARADVDNSTGTNVQEGDNRSTGNQRGSSSSGDAVGGQVTGVVSSGRTSVDATNVSRDSSVESGEASGSNSANTFTGLNTSEETNVGGGTAADVTGVSAANLQEGDNRTTYNQTASYTTGDGVAGQVIGAVTAAGGSASIVAANTSTDVSVQTGDAEGDSNDLAAFTGLNLSDSISVIASDIEGSCNVDGCANVQEGDNRTRARQSESASTGDGVAGQVIGAVSAGATSIDATNRSEGVDVQTGDASTDNDASLFTGLNSSDGATEIGGGDAADILDTCAETGCDNVQEGDNNTSVNQSASASTGDGVAGSVIGAVTSAGGSASIVAANTSLNSDVTTGEAESNNDLAAFVGLQTAGPSGTSVVADIEGTCLTGCFNVQEGDNRLSGSQTARSSTGDGVAGQVLGAVSAGATSIDATNRSEDVSVDTGDAESNNDASEFVGLNVGPSLTVGEGVVADVEGVEAANVQEGDNRKTLSQSADASSGDAVAGQVGGVVTSAGGSASVVLANTSTGIDSSTGDTEFDNDEDAFVGLNVTGIIT